MRVCIVNFNIYCLFNPLSGAPMGGAELDMYVLAKGLCQKGFIVSIVTADWGQQKKEEYFNISVFKSARLGNGNYVKAFFKFWSALSESSSDVYITSGAGPEVGILALYCKLFNKKFIYRTAHEIDCNGEFVYRNGISGKIFEFGLLHASKIVTSVRNHQALLERRYEKLASGNNIEFLPLAIEMENSNQEREEKKSILWIARGVKWKRPELFLDIVEKFDKEDFIMIMPPQKGEELFFNSIKDRARKLKNMTFIGGVTFTETQKFFNRAKLFVNTSDNEGFTYTLIQSGLARTPVVYLNVNPDDVITNYNLGEFGEGKIDNLICGIGKLCENEAYWVEKSNAIYEYVMSNHDINLLAVRWRVLIEDILITK